MFTLNGIVYASEKPEIIQITSVKPLEDMMIIDCAPEFMYQNSYPYNSTKIAI